jgi:UDP-N-acetylglucosamine 3-dehydrogenase
MTAMKTLKTAVIGLGNMGKHHARHLYNLECSKLVAVCDNDRERAESYAKNYNCKAYTDFETMLDNETIEAVSLTVPTRFHYACALTLLNKGIHLLIEKPISQTLEEADEIIALASKKGLTVTIGHVERFNPAIVSLKKLINEGGLGDIISLVSRRINVFPKQMKDANVAIDLGVHDIDLVSYLLDEEPVSISSQSARALIDNRADHLDILLHFKKASAFIQVNWITPTPVRELKVTGTKGYAELNYMTKEVKIYPSTYEELRNDEGEISIQFLESTPYNLDVVDGDALGAELCNFIESAQSNIDPVTTGEMGKTALKWALESLKD